MTARVITLNIAKGGVGKSTITAQLAGVFAARGLSVAVIDGDKTKTSADFFSCRNITINNSESTAIPFVKCERADPKDDIKQALKHMRDIYDVILIDTLGGQSNLFKSSVQMSDVILIPCEPSKKSFDQLFPTCSVIAEIDENIRAVDGWEDFRSDVRIVLNKTKPLSKSFKRALDMKKELSGAINFTKTIIPVIEALNSFEDDESGLTLVDNKHPKRAVFELLADELMQGQSIYQES